jgi:hypothetical protein
MHVKSSSSSCDEEEARKPEFSPRKYRHFQTPGSACLFHFLSASVCAVVFVLSAGVALRHWRRTAELQPLLSAVADDAACMHKQLGTCALKLTGDESNRFDLHPAENPLLGFIWQQVVSQSLSEMREVLSGAHVVIADPNGEAYAFLQSLPGAVRRHTSTHRSNRAQYDIPEGRVVASLLMGYLDDATWFQLEGAPWDLHNDFWQSMGHVFDTTEYALSLMSSNVGPLGTSKYTDRNPLRKSAIVPVHKACPEPCDSRLPQFSLAQSPGGSLGVGWFYSEPVEQLGARHALLHF